MQRGTVPGEAHTLAFAGSTPASATATPRGEGRLSYGRPRGFDSLRRDPLGVAQPGRAPAPGAGDWGFESLHPDHEERGTSELANAPVPQTGLAGFDPLVPHHARFGVGRYGDLISLIRRSLRVRLTATPPRGARSLGEHRRDEPDQVGSIPTPRTAAHHVTVAERGIRDRLRTCALTGMWVRFPPVTPSAEQDRTEPAKEPQACQGARAKACSCTPQPEQRRQAQRICRPATGGLGRRDCPCGGMAYAAASGAVPVRA